MIGWLVKDFFGASPMLAFPKIALVIFAVVFVVVTVRALLLDKSDIEAQARLALEDGRSAGGPGAAATSSFETAPVKSNGMERHHG